MQLSLLPVPEHVLSAYSNLKGKIPEAAGFFVADSERVVLKLLQSGLAVDSVLATESWYAEHVEEVAEAKVPALYRASKQTLEGIIGFPLHQGVMARARMPADAPLEALYGAPLVVLDGITKADNVGAVVRNAAAFGVTSVLVGPDTVHPFHRRSVRSSMGNVFPFKVHQARHLPSALAELKANGTTIYAFENRPFAQALEGTSFASSSALIIGSEGVGISPTVLEMADHFIRIPIDQHVYALNAACASAVALYAFSLRRT